MGCSKQQINRIPFERIDEFCTTVETFQDKEQKERNIEKYRKRATKGLPLFEDGGKPSKKPSVKGYTYLRNVGKYKAFIWDGRNKKTIHLGHFRTAREARSAYLRAKRNLKK